MHAVCFLFMFLFFTRLLLFDVRCHVLTHSVVAVFLVLFQISFSVYVAFCAPVHFNCLSLHLGGTP